jgi:hypothetical protein
MSLLSDELKSYVDLAVGKAIAGVRTAVGTVVTSPSQVSTDILSVTIDGGAVAVPVKGFRALPVFPGARVALVKFGSDWTVVGAYTNPGAGTGSSRMVIGSDVPAELRSYGIDTAILTYITDKNTGLEVGYFFIGGSNRFDGGANDNRVQAFGNVLYPTPGAPTTATSSNVKTNFQQNMFAPYPQTIFKDQRVTFWTQVTVDGQNAASGYFEYIKSDGTRVAWLDDNDLRAGTPGTSNTETWHAATLQNSWSNFGSGFVTAQYRRIVSPAKSVECIGVVTGGTSTGGTVVFNLPVGYRPVSQQRNVAYGFGASMNITTETPALDVTTGGNVTLTAMTNAGVVSFHFLLSLDA